MKISVACDNGMISNHFGHCESFKIYELNQNQVLKSETIPNPGHRRGFLPVFLHEKGVDVIIACGMGRGAIDIFNDKGIEVIVGASGSPDEAIQLYLQGSLKSTGSVCHEHLHQGQCEG